MVEVTDEDRRTAASVAVLAEMRELILSGRADHHAEPWAKYRIAAEQRGKLEGARLAIEAAADRAYVKCAEMRHVTLGDACRQSIRALSPAKIVGEG